MAKNAFLSVPVISMTGGIDIVFVSFLRKGCTCLFFHFLKTWVNGGHSEIGEDGEGWLYPYSISYTFL